MQYDSFILIKYFTCSIIQIMANHITTNIVLILLFIVMQNDFSLSVARCEDSDTFNAIKKLHTKLDLDADGEVDDNESRRFLGETGPNYNAKLKYLHQDGKDRSISVDELWDAWKNSQAHNWTLEDTIYWLNYYVELPEYSDLFERNSINGTILPRLAADKHFLNEIGILDPSAKKKISIKAMDVVLFGPPKFGNSSKVRDIFVSLVTLAAFSLCFVFYKRSLQSQKALQAMHDHLESLQRAEDQMQELVTEKKNLEQQLEMQRQSSSKDLHAPHQLKSLLRETYNIESKYLYEKKLNLESKATELKMRNQKLQKKKTSFLGYYKMAQENSLEDDINTIVEVKEQIMEVTKEIKERTGRWKAIEELCNCSLDLTPSLLRPL